MFGSLIIGVIVVDKEVVVVVDKEVAVVVDKLEAVVAVDINSAQELGYFLDSTPNQSKKYPPHLM